MESYILHKPLFQHSSKPVRGTGFIAELPVMGQNKVLLMTSYNVLPSMSVAQKSDIYFGRISDDYPGTMIKGKDLFDSDFFKTDEEVSLVYIAFAGVSECITFFSLCNDVSCLQFPGWNRKFGYTAVEVKLDVFQKHLKQEDMPKPLSLTKCADVMEKEGLQVDDMLYKVHYPAAPKSYIRCETADRICVVEGT